MEQNQYNWKIPKIRQGKQKVCNQLWKLRQITWDTEFHKLDSISENPDGFHYLDMSRKWESQRLISNGLQGMGRIG